MLTDEQLKEISKRSKSHVITYEGGVPVVSWCDDDKRENYEAEIPAGLAESAQDDIPALLAHIEHQRRAMEWAITHQDELNNVCDTCPDAIHDGCDRRKRKPECKIALAMDMSITKEATC